MQLVSMYNMILLPKSKAVLNRIWCHVKFDYKSLIKANMKISKVIAML